MKKKVKKRFFAILLLLAIVFTNVGTDFFYVQASSIEANESVQEENTETKTCNRKRTLIYLTDEMRNNP